MPAGKRSTGATAANEHSSRSHMVFMLTITGNHAANGQSIHGAPHSCTACRTRAQSGALPHRRGLPASSWSQAAGDIERGWLPAGLEASQHEQLG